MNGIHDMGGMDGMGPIEYEANEPVFHELWEGRVVALLLRMDPWTRGRKWGSFRYIIESIPAPEYLRMSYYERWFTMLVTPLLGSNLITQEELENGKADPNLPRPQPLPESAAELPRYARVEVDRPPKFRPDEPVRVRNLHPRGHIRLPRYVRGTVGTVIREHGAFPLQESDEDGQWLDYDPQYVYTVRFASRELWGDRGSANDSVYVDIWENHLESA